VIRRARCVSDDLGRGDAVVFHSHTVHRSIPNTTDRMRLSVDYRFRREGEAVTDGSLEPHFSRLSWDEIYRDWTRANLQYYWQKKRYTVDPAFHELSEEEHRIAMQDPMNWRREDRRLLALELLKLGKISLERQRLQPTLTRPRMCPERSLG
jgi:Phytanoyl-CoA dioxygenase (PhyH)